MLVCCLVGLDCIDGLNLLFKFQGNFGHFFVLLAVGAVLIIVLILNHRIRATLINVVSCKVASLRLESLVSILLGGLEISIHPLDSAIDGT